MPHRRLCQAGRVWSRDRYHFPFRKRCLINFFLSPRRRRTTNGHCSYFNATGFIGRRGGLAHVCIYYVHSNGCSQHPLKWVSFQGSHAILARLENATFSAQGRQVNWRCRP
ncbi:hypothetical protein ARMGADRAFT_610001 [Armillaria gallica]|uniref:Uncharacterized protein n=1 Tax=Armillaria gallica TaxID=47427 RepID=A0A2H3CMF3_ARMGA|nr:hypothetical protein ARMGADRAFT_610001 [Armillaria gallica]